MSGDESAHTFQPTPQTATKLKVATIIFKIGNGLDDWSNSLKEGLAKDGLVLSVSEGINLRVNPDKSIDPHYWLSIPNAMIITKNIAKQLIALDPANKDYYQSNETVYLKKLQAADTEIKEQLQSLPQNKIVTFHDAWYYFAEQYGLKIVATYEENIETDPSPEYLARFIQSVRKNNIHTIFYEPQFSSLSIKKIATHENLVSDILHPMESGGDTTSDSYIATMKENATKIYQALETQ
jgi:zinc transport system substrate-binding protein